MITANTVIAVYFLATGLGVFVQTIVRLPMKYGLALTATMFVLALVFARVGVQS